MTGDSPIDRGSPIRSRQRITDYSTQIEMDVVRQSGHGWIEVIVGSMFSGKSEELIRRLRRAQIARQKVQILKPKIDTLYAYDHIVSHSEMRIPSRAFVSSRALLDLVEGDTEVVGIDEG